MRLIHHFVLYICNSGISCQSKEPNNTMPVCSGERMNANNSDCKHPKCGWIRWAQLLRECKITDVDRDVFHSWNVQLAAEQSEFLVSATRIKFCRLTTQCSCNQLHGRLALTFWWIKHTHLHPTFINTVWHTTIMFLSNGSLEWQEASSSLSDHCRVT